MTSSSIVLSLYCPSIFDTHRSQQLPIFLGPLDRYTNTTHLLIGSKILATLARQRRDKFGYRVNVANLIKMSEVVDIVNNLSRHTALSTILVNLEKRPLDPDYVIRVRHGDMEPHELDLQLKEATHVPATIVAYAFQVLLHMTNGPDSAIQPDHLRFERIATDGDLRSTLLGYQYEDWSRALHLVNHFMQRREKITYKKKAPRDEAEKVYYATDADMGRIAEESKDQDNLQAQLTLDFIEKLQEEPDGVFIPDQDFSKLLDKINIRRGRRGEQLDSSVLDEMMARKVGYMAMVDADTSRKDAQRPPTETAAALDQTTLRRIWAHGDNLHATPRTADLDIHLASRSYRSIIDQGSLQSYLTSQAGMIEAMADQYASLDGAQTFDDHLYGLIERAEHSFITSVVQNRNASAQVDLQDAMRILGMDPDNWEDLKFNIEHTTQPQTREQREAGVPPKVFRFLYHQLAGKCLTRPLPPFQASIFLGDFEVVRSQLLPNTCAIVYGYYAAF